MRLAQTVLVLLLPLVGAATSACAKPPAHTHVYPVMHTDAEWRKLLTPEQYEILRNQGTERPFGNNFHDSHDKVIFVCAGCGQELFSWDKKFDSGTGWPSFWAPVDEKAVETAEDLSAGMARNEVRCARCGGHLGHVFDDGPKPTGLRYCIDGVALKKKPVKP